MFKPSRNALVLFVAAVMLMLSAGAGATAALVITGKQIKDGTITTSDIKNKSLKVKDFSTRTTSKLRGATGPAGTRGATGAAGVPGAAGLSGFEVVTKTVTIPGFGGTDAVSAVCPAGKKALSATASYAAPLTNLVSQVTRTGDSAFSATGLNLLGSITGQVLTLDMVCAAIPS